MTAPLWLWGVFAAVVTAALVFDLATVGRRNTSIGVGSALRLTGLYVALAVAFGGLVWWRMGDDPALAYFTGYALEKSLSVDNIFVFFVILSYFGVPREYQHRVLFWGVIGALIMRGIFIVLGAGLIQEFHWMLYVFGIVVLVSGVRLLRDGGVGAEHIEGSALLKFLRRRMRVTDDYGDGRFFVVRNGGRCATLLFLVLVFIELSDLLFALDSLPAIFGVTRNEFLIYSSNAFAVLGLRALYFALAGLAFKFEYLRYGLSLVLILIGIKMFIEPMMEIPAWVTLIATLGIVSASMVASAIWGNHGGGGPARRAATGGARRTGQ